MDESNVIVMTTAQAIPEHQQAVLTALEAVAQAARGQSGCLEYHIFRSTADSTVTVNFERWMSDEERDAFNAGPVVQAFAQAVSGKFATPPQPARFSEGNERN